MVGATATATATNTTTTSSTMSQTSPPASPLKSEIRFSKKYTCAMCELEFESSVEQRSHMRDPWHVQNLRRKIEGLPLLNAEEHRASSLKPSKGESASASRQAHLRTAHTRHQISSSESEVESLEIESSSASGSDLDSDSDAAPEESVDARTEGNPEATSHASISNAVHLTDANELRLSSGKILGNKTSKRNRQQSRQKENEERLDQSVPPRHHSQSPPLTVAYLESETQRTNSSNDRKLALRDSGGLIGISDLEHRALRAVAKKMVSLEVRTKGGYQAGVDMKGNCQKHYRIGGSRGGKKMGGLEKRLG